MAAADLTASTWLDLLPHEATYVILGALCEWNHFSSPVNEACALASVSHKLRQAVQKFLNNTAVLFTEEDFTSVLTLFPHGAKNVELFTSTEDHSSLIYLLQSPELRMANNIEASETLTEALLVKKSVIYLELSVRENINADHIIVLLRDLHLKRLKLNCYVDLPAKYCLSNSYLSKPDHEHSIPALCPDLEQLDISCRRDKNNSIFFRMLPHLRLTQTKLCGHVRESALHQLREMESVRLSHVYQTVYNAERIGEAVTEIESFETLDAQDLEILLGCTRIEALDISVEAANIGGLLELVRGLQNLKKLRVRFNPGQHYSGKRRRGLESLPEGAVLNLFTSSQTLADIGIVGVKVPLEEILESMRMTGRRLQKLTADLKGQEEGMFDRMEALLDCMYKFCPRVEYTCFTECWCISSIKSQLRRKGKDYSKRRIQQKAIGQRLSVLIEGLKRRTRWREGPGRIEELVELLL